MTTTDEQLLRRVAAGDDRALMDLHDRYYARLVRFVSRLLDDESLIDEVANDTFVVVWQRAASFRGRSAPSTWILGIGYKKALKAQSRRRRFVALTDHVALVDGPASGHATGHDLRRLLGELSPPLRAVMTLTYGFGYSYREIADILGCPVNTVKTRMFKARKALAHGLEDTVP